MKFQKTSKIEADGTVAPHAGAWIEIVYGEIVYKDDDVAPHAGAWIEICYRKAFDCDRRVAPHAGAWIEMLCYGLFWLF